MMQMNEAVTRGQVHTFKAILNATKDCKTDEEFLAAVRAVLGEEDRIMNIVIAVALLIMLIVHIGKKNSDPRSAQKNHKHDDPDWIDELEVLDAVWDDSI